MIVIYKYINKIIYYYFIINYLFLIYIYIILKIYQHVNNQLYSRSQEYLEIILDILKKNTKLDDKLSKVKNNKFACIIDHLFKYIFFNKIN